jgi:hypothetical protein
VRRRICSSFEFWAKVVSSFGTNGFVTVLPIVLLMAFRNRMILLLCSSMMNFGIRMETMSKWSCRLLAFNVRSGLSGGKFLGPHSLAKR